MTIKEEYESIAYLETQAAIRSANQQIEAKRKKLLPFFYNHIHCELRHYADRMNRGERLGNPIISLRRLIRRLWKAYKQPVYISYGEGRFEGEVERD